MPLPLSGEWTYNVSPSIQDNLVTAGDRQFCVFVAAGRRAMIAARDHGSAEWETFHLGDVPGNPLAAPVAEDGHNFLSLAVDGDGHLHVAGNQHNHPLRYVRSTAPLSIREWRAAPMTGQDEESMGYPKFFSLPDGRLFFCHRAGMAGHGDLFLDRYEDGRRRRLHKLVDGIGGGESFYPNHVATRDGSIHLMGVWRTGRPTTVASTNDVAYARSDDGGETWVRADGSPQEVPITHADSERVLQAPPGSGLLNGGGLEVDPGGRPHGALLLNDERGTQVHHFTHDGAVWRVRPVTALGHTMVIRRRFADNVVSHPSVVTTAGGRALIVYRTLEPGRRGVRIVDAETLVERVLVDRDLGFWNPVFDTRALYERDELHLLLVPTADANDPHAGSLAPWASVDAEVLSLPLADVDALPVA